MKAAAPAANLKYAGNCTLTDGGAAEQGETMTEMTPERLEELIGHYDDNEGSDAVQADMRDCVSAWKADRKRLEQWEAEAQDKARPQVRPMTVLENAYMDLEGKLAATEARIEELEKERDEAIAHDRQPYPTAAAYETVCAARTKWQTRAEALVQELPAKDAEDVLIAALAGKEEKP